MSSTTNASKDSVFSRMFGVAQKLGKSLMLPVSVLPVAGILLGVGGALVNGADQNGWNLPAFLRIFFEIMANSGDPIFGALPLLFAIGVALGLTKNDGVSALAATVGYLVLNGTMNVIGKHMGLSVKTRTMSTILGMDTINTGVFGGIIIGAIAGTLFNRYYRISLPPYLGFFAGKRFVPIVTAFAAIAAGIVLSFIWPPIQGVIRSFGEWATTSSPLIATWIYGTVERSLLPFGLHHIWNAPFFYEIGNCVKTDGTAETGWLAGVGWSGDYRS